MAVNIFVRGGIEIMNYYLPVGQLNFSKPYNVFNTHYSFNWSRFHKPGTLFKITGNSGIAVSRLRQYSAH